MSEEVQINIERSVLMKYWPLNQNGPLPPLFADSGYIYDAFFHYFPAERKWPASAFRRALKQAAKQLRINHERLGNDLTQRKRDEILSFTFASSPRGRNALRDMTITLNDSRGDRRKGRWTTRVGESLPRILWSTYLSSPQYSELVNWTKLNGLPRPDLGAPGAFFLTAETLQAAFKNNPPPLPLDNEELARVIILFAALLPLDEAVDLVKAAALCGVECIRKHFLEGVQEDISYSNLQSLPTKQNNEIIKEKRILPRLEEFDKFIPLVSNNVENSTTALDLNKSFVQANISYMSAREEICSGKFSIVKLIDFNEDDYLEIISSVEKARSLSVSLNKINKMCHDYIDFSINHIVDRGFIEDNWRETIKNSELSLVDKVIYVDTIRELSNYCVDDRIENLWIPIAKAAKSKEDLLNAFKKIPSIKEYVESQYEKESDFIYKVRDAINSSGFINSEIANWMSNLKFYEIYTLVKWVDGQRFPVISALLVRLLVDASNDSSFDVDKDFLLIDDYKIRRNFLYFIDPSSVFLDELPNVQRVVISERLRDIFNYGPLVSITDPSLRLGEEGFVGTPLSILIDILVQHFDLCGNGIELRRFVRFSGELDDFSDRAKSNLIAYATTISSSSGLYLQLREAFRERFFAPLVECGEIDVKAAIRLSKTLSVEEAIELAAGDVRKENNRSVRIEPRHKARVHRYAQEGKDCLDEFIQSITTTYSDREREFSIQLSDAVSKLSKEGCAVGSREWLHNEVRKMLSDSPPQLEFPTLLGDATQLSARTWTSNDTAWAQQSLDVPEFYIKDRIPTLNIAASALRIWAADKQYSAKEIVEELASQGQFSAAISCLDEANISESDRQNFLKNINKLAEASISPLIKRLENIELEHGKETVSALSTYQVLRDALGQYEVDEATELLDFLEMEIFDLADSRRRSEADATIANERSSLMRKLLRSGVAELDERWSLDDLRGRWKAELSNRLAERAHLRVIEKVLDLIIDLPELSEDARQFSGKILEPDLWLPPQKSHSLTCFIESPTEKLKTWIQLGDKIDKSQWDALIELTRWFLRFVEEQATELRALDEAEAGDSILERALEVGDSIEQAGDPAACARSLGIEIDVDQDASSLISLGKLDSENINSKLLPFVEQGDWEGLSEAAFSLKLNASDEDTRRVVDIAEFASTMVALGDGRIGEARESLVTAARVLGANGHIINRALAVTKLVSTAFGFFSASITIEHNLNAGFISALPDGSWAPLMGMGPNLQDILQNGGLPARTLEQLCSGSLGREVVNRLWDAPTAKSEPGVLRASLLRFLYEHGLNEHLLFLSKMHDPSISSRLDQLLNLRVYAAQRPDFIPLSEAVARQIVKTAQGVPFRVFVAELPTATQTIDADLVIGVDKDIVLRIDKRDPVNLLSFGLSVEPRGLVPESIEVTLFPDDDVSFDDGSRRRRLSDEPVYFAQHWTLGVRFGSSWKETNRRKDNNFRIRVNARIITGELISRDEICHISRAELRLPNTRRIDNETLLDAFPGVENTPALGDTFIGRHEELERLHGALVSARRPSPVLLTGMRRIGKTSLLYAFHQRHRQPERGAPLTVYLSLAERRAGMMDTKKTVSAVFYSAIAHALGKIHFSSNDINRELGEKLKQNLGSERNVVQNSILQFLDPDSIADSLTVLSERILEWVGGATRIIYLVDEAETLVLPYRGGDTKRLELEQLLLGLREVSQTSTHIGILLSGSNHIAEFARSYKNAFFGSSLQIGLSGMTDPKTAGKIVSPEKLASYIEFKGEAVKYATDMCAGMPQFLWQLGGATAAIVRSGRVTKSDIRQGVSVLVGEQNIDLPFKAYEVLEPIEHMLGIQGQREQDLLWLLLWRVAHSSSLIADEAQQSFIIDQSLLELDEPDGWKSRLLLLVDLEILEISRPSMYRFRVPIFAEGFRAPRQEYSYRLRHQRAGA